MEITATIFLVIFSLILFIVAIVAEDKDTETKVNASILAIFFLILAIFITYAVGWRQGAIDVGSGRWTAHRKDLKNELQWDITPAKSKDLE